MDSGKVVRISRRNTYNRSHYNRSMPLVQTARKTLPWAFGMALSEDLLSLSDEELLALSLKKPSTFEILMTRYQRQFLTRAQNVLGSRDSAEDVVQEAFIRIYRFAPNFRGEQGTFRAWSLTKFGANR